MVEGARPAAGDEVIRQMALKKAELVIVGEVHVPEDVRLPSYPIRSAGGPTSTRPHFIIEFGPIPTRIKVAMGDEGSRLHLEKGEGEKVFRVMDGDIGFIEDVKVVNAIMHAPEMAFINIEPTCDRGCLFCSASDERAMDWPAERWVRVVAEAYERKGLSSVAITTGMPKGEETMIEKMVEVVSGIRDRLPGVPIGVEPNAVPREGLVRLSEAGADELKVNLQTATPDIFDKVCPGLDRYTILSCLRDGVDVFGPNRVCSNLIIGLGEDDMDIMECVGRLARIGVAANLRVLRLNRINIGPLRQALGKNIGIRDPDRLVQLVLAQKAIFDMYKVRPTAFRTMCHACGCCDLSVGIDV